MAELSKKKTLPALLIAPEEARSRLRKQIAVGSEILTSMAGHLTDSAFKDLSIREKTWRDYNETLLLSLFDSTEIAERFMNDTKVFEWVSSSTRMNWDTHREVTERHGTDPRESSRLRIQNQINSLESLIQRLDLHPNESAPMKTASGIVSPNVFIVHGHDKAAKESTIRFVEKLGLNPVVFDESPNKGRTIIEKLEELATLAAFVIVLFTPDDKGARTDKTQKIQRRARQNVIFELGFFVGQMGRDRVCLLYKEGAEIPSDLHGVLYVRFDGDEGWHVRLAREMKAANLAFDFNSIL
ncbi:MAG: TIR domain-containing protein [Solirubrobacterales bacterium]